MRQKKVWRYYCDHCKKSGGSKYHMANHESGCTNNPDRECSICKLSGNKQEPISKLIKALGDGTDLTRLRFLTDNCPMCILSAIRQSRLQITGFDPDENGIYKYRVDFDFSAEKNEFWKQYNIDQNQQY